MKFLFLFLFSFGSIFSVDIIITSFNRPLQLYALLESIEERVVGYNSISVILRSEDAYTEGYGIVKERFPEVGFFQQPANRNKAFHTFPYMIQDLVNGKNINNPSSYFLFAVDDIVVLDNIDLNQGREFLEGNPDIHGFYYRLGKNITHHFLPKPGRNQIPPLKDAGDDIFTWEFCKGTYDWGYPNTLDFTIYRKNALQKGFSKMFFRNPNELEAAWQAFLPYKGKGCCHSVSKIVNLCINRVNTTHRNPVIKECSVEFLNEKFMEGKKIDIFSLDKRLVNSAHQDVPFEFIERSR